LPEVSHHLIIPEVVIESALDNEVINDLCIQVGHRLDLMLAPAFKFEFAKEPALDSLQVGETSPHKEEQLVFHRVQEDEILRVD